VTHEDLRFDICRIGKNYDLLKFTEVQHPGIYVGRSGKAFTKSESEGGLSVEVLKSLSLIAFKFCLENNGKIAEAAAVGQTARPIRAVRQQT